jgi:hypothetical protein
MLLSWSSSESSPEKHLSPPKRTSDDFLPLLGVFEIEDEFGTWTFEEYSSNRKGGATFVVKLNGSPLLGDFGRFDKASFSHDLTRCKDETVKLDRFQLPGHLRYKGYGPKILKHLLSLYKEAGCLKIVVPSPTPSGTKCYEKVGFTRNALKTLEMNFRHGASSATESAQDLPARASSEAQDPSDDESRHSHAGCATEVSSDESVQSFSDSFDSHDDEADDGNISLAQDLEQRTTGVAITGYTVPVQDLQRRSNSLTDDSLRSLNDKNWSVERCEQGGARTGYVRLTEVNTQNTYDILPSRAPKAKLNLSHDGCMTAMMTNACQCRKNCNQLLRDPKDIANIRYPVYNCATEQEVNIYITDKLKATGGKFFIPVNGEMKKVCGKYYSRVHSVCLSRVKTAARIAKQGKSALKTKKKHGADTTAERAKFNTAYSFWSIFFEQNCQRPNNDIRIFPVDKSYNLIYQEYFSPWFDRLKNVKGRENDLRPSMTSFMRARHHDDFKDVKERAKHTHARCMECSTLRRLVLEGFKSGAQEEEYIQRRRLHDTEVKKWRELESKYKSQAVTDPSEVLVIMHDGTESLGLPRMTNRTLKNMDPTRFHVVPWLGEDHTAQRKDYIYSVKNAFPKDSNTLISEVHVMIRRAKSDYKHPRHKARKLVLIADSASENKNNILFAYVTDLVENKWFDEVELIFGPVGHTHNGVDACHKIHNQNVAGCVSGDIGHFVQNYPKGYSGQDTITPQASFLARSVDWTTYYGSCLRKIAGFTKTKNDPHMVRGFRIARQRDNTVSLTWKMDPATEDTWRGADGFGGSTGFYMLKSAPVGLPNFVPRPDTNVEEKNALRKLNSLNMQQAMKAEGLHLDSMKFNHRCAVEKSIIPHLYVEDEPPLGEWGRGCLVGGTDGCRGVLREIKHYWDPSLPEERSSLWALPIGANGEHHAATNNAHHYSADDQLLASRRLALVRYADERSQVVDHPNNVAPASGGWVPEADEPAGGEWVPEEVDDAVEENDGQDHGVEAENVQAAAEARSQLRVCDANRVWRFEEDFKKCQVNKFCIGLGVTTAGPSPYVFLGKITSVNQDEKTFKCKLFKCTVDPWTPACLDKPWHAHPQDDEDENPHYSVMHYFAKLKQNKAIPKAAKDAVDNRRIQWARD